MSGQGSMSPIYRKLSEQFRGGVTRKIVIDVDLEADDEEALDRVEEKMRSEFSPGGVVVSQDMRRVVTVYRITAAEVVNEGAVEI